MSLLGKILAVLILLAAGGFAYLAVQGWKGRQTITAAGLRHVLVLEGLPLDGPPAFDTEKDETPFRVPMAGGTSTETVSKKLLDGYCAAAGGGTAAARAGTPAR